MVEMAIALVVPAILVGIATQAFGNAPNRFVALGGLRLFEPLHSRPRVHAVGGGVTPQLRVDTPGDSVWLLRAGQRVTLAGDPPPRSVDLPMNPTRWMPGSHRETRTSDRGGFSLIEVMVALVILTVGVLGLVGTTVWAVRQSTLSELTTERTAAVQSVVEQLRASDYAGLAVGSDSVGRFDLSWTVTAGSRSKLVTVVSVGPGLSSGGGMPSLTGSVADTFDYRIMRP